MIVTVIPDILLVCPVAVVIGVAVEVVAVADVADNTRFLSCFTIGIILVFPVVVVVADGVFVVAEADVAKYLIHLKYQFQMSNWSFP